MAAAPLVVVCCFVAVAAYGEGGSSRRAAGGHAELGGRRRRARAARVPARLAGVRGVAVREAEAAAPVLGGGDGADAGAREPQLPAVRGAGLGRVSRHALVRVLRAHRHRAGRAQHAVPALQRDQEPVLQVRAGREVHGRVRLVPLHRRPRRLVHQPVLRVPRAAPLRAQALRRRVLLTADSLSAPPCALSRVADCRLRTF